MYYEFLDGRDAVFLALEDATCPMTVGAVQHFAVDTPANEIATIDIARIRSRIADRLHLLPRFRQCVSRIPIAQVPIWIDDPGFSLDRHVRQEAVTSDTIGKRIDDLIATPFTRQRPLWEIIFLDGYSATEVTAVLKAHHALFDGVARRLHASRPVRPRPGPANRSRTTPLGPARAADRHRASSRRDRTAHGATCAPSPAIPWRCRRKPFTSGRTGRDDRAYTNCGHDRTAGRASQSHSSRARTSGWPDNSLESRESPAERRSSLSDPADFRPFGSPHSSYPGYGDCCVAAHETDPPYVAEPACRTRSRLLLKLDTPRGISCCDDGVATNQTGNGERRCPGGRLRGFA